MYTDGNCYFTLTASSRLVQQHLVDEWCSLTRCCGGRGEGEERGRGMKGGCKQWRGSGRWLALLLHSTAQSNIVMHCFQCRTLAHSLQCTATLWYWGQNTAGDTDGGVVDAGTRGGGWGQRDAATLTLIDYQGILLLTVSTMSFWVAEFLSELELVYILKLITKKGIFCSFWEI